jgi:hypothetical protein
MGRPVNHSGLDDEFFKYIFLIILQNYTIISEFIRFDHQPEFFQIWPPTAVAHNDGGLTAVSHGD